MRKFKNTGIRFALMGALRKYLSQLCLNPACCRTSMARGCFGSLQSLNISHYIEKRRIKLLE